LAEEEGTVKIIDCAMQRSKSIKDIMMENNDISHISDYRKIGYVENIAIITRLVSLCML